MADPELHLTLELVDHPYGRCQAILTDDDGQVLLDQVYKNKNSAQASVRTRLKKEGLRDARISRIHPGEAEPDTEDDAPEDMPIEAPSTAPARPGDRWLHKLRTEAQRVLDEAAKLRERADILEVEHKRLSAAADVLEGPEG